jgi:outer membrane protein insertion porin family
MRAGQKLSKPPFDEDDERLAAYYRGLGFLRVRIASETRVIRSKEESAGSKNAESVAVVFIIDEGDQYRIRNISIDGNKRFDNDALLRQMPFKSGNPFTTANMLAGHKSLLKKYEAAGYTHAAVTLGTVLHQDAEVDVSFNIEEVVRTSRSDK